MNIRLLVINAFISSALCSCAVFYQENDHVLHDNNISILVAQEDLYPALRQVVVEEKERVLSSIGPSDRADGFCNDMISHLSSYILWYKNSTSQWREVSDGGVEYSWIEYQERIPGEEWLISDLIDIAFRSEAMTRLLIAKGYQNNHVRTWVEESETTFVNWLFRIHSSKGDEDEEDYGSYPIIEIARKANAYRATMEPDKRLPTVSEGLPECGGPLHTTAFNGEGLKNLYIIPRGFYKICQRVLRINPDDIEECEYWRSVSLDKTRHEVDGWYRYKAIWNDGKITHGRVDFDYLPYDETNTTTIVR